MQGVGSDPMLWLYTQAGELVAQNDDWYGLQSNLDLLLAPGTYRLRAGFCCGDPDATRPGQVYDLSTSAAPVTPNADPTTTYPQSTTTSVEPSTTTQPPETTSTTDAPTTTLPETTTSVAETIPTTQPVVTDAPTTTGEPVPQTDQVGTSIVDVSTTEEIPTTTTTTTVADVAPTTSSAEPQPTVVTTILTTILPTSSRPLPEPRPTATIPPTTALEATTTTEPPTTSTTELLVTTTLVEAEPISPEPITELPADIQNLTETEKAQLVEQLNDAPVELKRQFEQTVNVFGGGFDDYVPADQRVPVGTRRTLIAVTGALVTLSSTAPARRNRR